METKCKYCSGELIDTDLGGDHKECNNCGAKYWWRDDENTWRSQRNNKLTDKDCFEIMTRWGNEKILSMIKEMVAVSGEAKTADNIILTYEINGKSLPDEFKDFIKRGVAYMSNKSKAEN